MLLGEKIKIRAIAKADLEALQKLYNEPEILPYIDVRPHISLGFLEEKFRGRMDDHDTKGEWLLIEDSEGSIIGSISYNFHWNPVVMFVNSFFIGKEYQCKGYGIDVIKTLCRFVFEQKGSRRIEAVVCESNPAAVRVFEKAGFTREGVRRCSMLINGECTNEVFMSMLSKEYFK